jgi:hypothetical protein
MARPIVLLSSTLGGSALVLFATLASADEVPVEPEQPPTVLVPPPAPPAAAEPDAPPAPVVVTTTTKRAAPPRPATTNQATVAGEVNGNDHDGVVGHFAVGYFGISQLPVGALAAGGGGGGGQGFVSAPVIGARYWIGPRLGIDAGVGFGYTDTSGTSNWGIALHAGVPIALATSHHFTFELTPEATLGFAGGSVPGVGGGNNAASLSGFRLDLGAKIGAELQFGFIGIPQLSLQANVGVYLQQEAWGYTAPGINTSTTSTTLSTSVGSDPWAIFTDTVSALYYF